MNDKQVPPEPGRLAIVIIHGIGNQQPLDTMFPFVNNLIEEPARPGEPKYWSKPDRISDTFELRRMTARKGQGRPTTDFYEYYWAHRIPGATLKQIWTWFRRVVFVNPKNLIPKIRKYQVISLAFLMLVVIGYISISVPVISKWLAPGLDSIAAKVVAGIFYTVVVRLVLQAGHTVLTQYVGDAARYLHPDPENIQIRQAIRANGVRLLKKLHEVDHKGKQKYSRIVVVGHSLGSVIAYDIVNILWNGYNKEMESGPESLLHALHDCALKLKDDPTPRHCDEYQSMQRLYWKERYDALRDAGQSAWLISDLVTLGSPLTHAEVLLKTKDSSLSKRIRHRELPTCPPEMEQDRWDNETRFAYRKHGRSGPTNTFVPHHAAVFSCTRWTNMFFAGDAVGDRLAEVFGFGIKDIELSTSNAKKHKWPTSHTVYWKNVKGSDSHLGPLRQLLGFKNYQSMTKRKYALAQNCEKALWLDSYQPELKAPNSEADLLLFEQGNAVDEAAQLAYEGGNEIDGSFWEATLNTEAALEAGFKLLYQAAFEHEELKIRPDIIEIRDDGAFVLREVKMSTSFDRNKTRILQDIAFQLYVLQCKGFRVAEAKAVLINKSYVSGIDEPRFTETDVTADAQQIADQIESDRKRFKNVLDLKKAPAVAIGSQCSRCGFKPFCWKDIPDGSIYQIPRLSAKNKDVLVSRNVLLAKDVPEDVKISDKQRAYVNLQRSGKSATDKAAIRDILAGLEKPYYFLDFETFSTPLPVWPNTRPHKDIPFQYSCHKLDEEELTHAEYLHRSFDDPRAPIVEGLLEVLGSKGTIFVYQQVMEEGVLRSLMEQFPKYQPQLENIIARLFDQLQIVRKHVREPILYGSNTLKNVNDKLLESVNYSELDVREGLQARAAWYNMTSLPETERDGIAQALLAYCEQDTLAQVKLHEWFMKA
ncbi:MAG: DUF2779 domain-containing protein [Bacteroidota bacterium]